MARYVIDGSFDTKDTTTINGDGFVATITTETADLVDTRGGYRYHQGAFRVRVRCEPVQDGQPKTKTFKGETAWSAAERYAEDARWFFRRIA